MEIEFVYYFFAGIYYTVVGAVQKIGFKKRLRKALGRKVSNQELISITTWMRATPDQTDTTKVQPPVSDVALSNRVRGF